MLDYYKLDIIVEYDVLGTVGRNLSVSFLLMASRRVDLPQVDCERASENEGRSRATRAKVANLFSC